MQKKKKEPQTVQILKWLQRGRKLTQARAYELFGCFRLSARIFDLNEEGWDIKSNMIITPSGKKVAEYSL